MVDSRFFKSNKSLKLSEIAMILDCSIDPKYSDKLIQGVAPIETATDDNVTFVSNVKYFDKLSSCKAGACIIDVKFKDKAPRDLPLILSNNPYFSYATIANEFFSNSKLSRHISPNANISTTAKIGKDCRIEAGAYVGDNAEIGNNTTIKSGAYIEENVKIGNNCIVHSSVNVCYSIIGDNVIIHGGASIGQDGFGYAFDSGTHHKVPQLGRVIIENDVEIGANTCIDRGAGPDTIIGEGTKIDNLVQIGHNVKIGKGCIVVSHVGISGSTKIGNYVVIGGQVGIAGHLEIGNNIQIAAKSGVINNLESGKSYGGAPAIGIKEWHRQTISIKNLGKKRKIK